MSLRKTADDPSTTPAFPWWIVVGRREDGQHFPARISSSSKEMAKAEFERRFPAPMVVVSVAKEVYRHDDYN